MIKKCCGECPWKVKSRNNTSITNHAKRLKKKHNCHMVDASKRGSLWDVKDEYQCVGNREHVG